MLLSLGVNSRSIVLPRSCIGVVMCCMMLQHEITSVKGRLVFRFFGILKSHSMIDWGEIEEAKVRYSLINLVRSVDGRIRRR